MGTEPACALEMKLLDIALYGRIMFALVTCIKWDFALKELEVRRGKIARIYSMNRSVLGAQMYDNVPSAMRGLESVFSRTEKPIKADNTVVVWLCDITAVQL